MRDRWWWGAPGVALAGSGLFGLWVMYGFGDSDTGEASLVRGVGLIVWWVVMREYVERATKRS